MSVSKQTYVSRKKKASGGFGETLRTLIYAVLIAIGVRTVAYEPFNIPSGSMIPTLLVGDYLFVSKFSYGYSRFSMPLSPNLFDGRILERAPERGDVAVFKRPPEDRTDFIKRLVGLPGDRIQVVGGILHINGEPVKRERLEDYVERDERGNVMRAAQYLETLPNGRSHLIIERFGDGGPLDNTAEFTVPPGHYFAMGDNRDNSADGRGNGSDPWFVPAENLIGRAEFLFYSTDGTASWWEVWRWPLATRYGRIFSGVD